MITPARHGRQMIQARQTVGDDLLVRREAVVRQGLPVGQGGHHLVGELLDLVAQPQGVLHVRRDQHHRAIVAFDDLGAFHGAGRAGQLPQLAQIARAVGQRITGGWGTVTAIGSAHSGIFNQCVRLRPGTDNLAPRCCL